MMNAAQKLTGTRITEAGEKFGTGVESPLHEGTICDENVCRLWYRIKVVECKGG